MEAEPSAITSSVCGTSSHPLFFPLSLSPLFPLSSLYLQNAVIAQPQNGGALGEFRGQIQTLDGQKYGKLMKCGHRCVNDAGPH